MNKLTWWKQGGAACVLCAAAAIAVRAQTFTTVHSFEATDGADPDGTLVQATDGNLYGTSILGGDLQICGLGCGAVFKITPSGTTTLLASVCFYKSCPDGASPYAGVIQASDGNFYGTAATNGAFGYGTIYRVTPSGTLAALHNFDRTDGEYPYAGLVQGIDGNLYGVTDGGGAYGYGTVFKVKITPPGTLTTLYSFCSEAGCTDGLGPNGALIQATDGNFYGITGGGGASGYGTVFKMSPSGALTTLYSFCPETGCTDGLSPNGPLVEGTDGNFYGTTAYGGANDSCQFTGFPNGCGTIFKISPQGVLTTLYSFCPDSGCTDGEYPGTALVQGTDGNFYGTTAYGGANQSCDINGSTVGCGTIFKVSPSGTLTTLYSFCSGSACSDGQGTGSAALVQHTNGTFYGVTFDGGVNNWGTVFSLSVGLGPFVKTQPASGKAGAVIKILGTDLTGATSVTFHGTAATFAVVSNSEITATVPTGAKTGKVQVATPGGTLSSNFPFRVVP